MFDNYLIYTTISGQLYCISSRWLCMAVSKKKKYFHILVHTIYYISSTTKYAEDIHFEYSQN